MAISHKNRRILFYGFLSDQKKIDVRWIVNSRDSIPPPQNISEWIADFLPFEMRCGFGFLFIQEKNLLICGIKMDIPDRKNDL